MKENWEKHNQELIACRRCPRLVAWCEKVAREKRAAFRNWEYWGKPVPAFGDEQARLLILGLAPGAHGSNRTGRMFTGDGSGLFLYDALQRAGFANQPHTDQISDGLALQDALISAVGRCAPPDNKPTPEELRNCRPWLLAELEMLPNLEGIVVLGKIAFDAAWEIYGNHSSLKERPVFGHGAFYELGDGLPWLLASYHPSRQNTQTGRLTVAMFDAIWQYARQLLKK
jgi:uracil-DNA glycosylase family 4